MFHGVVSRALAGAIIAVLGVPLSGNVAVADTGVSEHGVVGVHALVDTLREPGVTCRYNPAFRALSALSVRPPQAFAVDRSSAIDHQDIAVRARFQTLVHLSSGVRQWVDRGASPWDRRSASDEASPFDASPRFVVGSPGRWRVEWDFRWFKAGSNVVTGSSTHRVDIYGQRIGLMVRAGNATNACRATLAGQPAVKVGHGSLASSEVALTFDFGGTGGKPREIVTWLVDHGVPATVFATGVASETKIGRRVLAMIAAHRDLIDIGNHSFDHPDFTRQNSEQIKAQLTKAEKAIAPLARGTTKPLFRPPFGRSDADTLVSVGAAGWALLVRWDVTTNDYVPRSLGGPTPAELVAEVLSKAHGGSIVVLHLTGPPTLAALPGIVDGLRAEGLEPVTLRQLLQLD